VPTSSLVEVKNGKDTIVKYKDEKDSLIIVNYDLIKKLIKRGEPPNWGGRPGMRTIKYKCGT
jgi:tRNA uridine 5-carbamoylmethylation protein Kti12